MYEVPYLLFKSVFRSRHKLKISWISCSRILIEDQHRIALLVAELDLPQCANYVQAGVEPCSEIRWIGPAGLCQANSAIWKSIGNEYVIENIKDNPSSYFRSPVPATGWKRQPLAFGAADIDWSADLPTGNGFINLNVSMIEAAHVAHHQFQAGFACGFDHRVRF